MHYDEPVDQNGTPLPAGYYIVEVTPTGNPVAHLWLAAAIALDWFVDEGWTNPD